MCAQRRLRTVDEIEFSKIDCGTLLDWQRTIPVSNQNFAYVKAPFISRDVRDRSLQSKPHQKRITLTTNFVRNASALRVEQPRVKIVRISIRYVIGKDDMEVPCPSDLNLPTGLYDGAVVWKLRTNPFA